MKRKLLGGSSCLLMSGVCLAGSFLTLFIGSIIFNQSQAGMPTATRLFQSTIIPTRLAASPLPTRSIAGTVGAPKIDITIERQSSATLDQPGALPGNPTGTPTLSPMITTTPGLAPLGTMSYPLTVTAESQIASTRLAAFRGSLAGTRTAVAAESETIFATLTAAAPVPGQ